VEGVTALVALSTGTHTVEVVVNVVVVTGDTDAELCAAARLHKSNGGNSVVRDDRAGITKGDTITVDCTMGDAKMLVRVFDAVGRERLVAVDAEAVGSETAGVEVADSKGKVGNGEASGSSICNACAKQESRYSNQSVIYNTSQQQQKAHLKNMRVVNIRG